MTRLCLIGLPRCGSQYISSLLKINTDLSCRNLSEPFTPNHEISLKDIGSNVTAFHSYADQVSAVINLLKEINQDQSLILKLFLHSWLPIEQFVIIIDELTKMGFQFVIIKRKNTIDQILSWGVALTVNKFTNFDAYDDSKIVIDTKVLEQMKVLQTDINMFDHLIKELQLENSPVLCYETIHMDLYRFLKRQININSGYNKMSNIKSADRILNIDKVLTFLNTL